MHDTFEDNYKIRLWQANILEELGGTPIMSNWTEASILFRGSGRKNLEFV